MDKLIISETPIHIAKETIVHEIAWGGVTGNIVDQADLNTVLDAFADDLSNLAEEVETKASAAAVVQALTTKADLIDGVIPASQLPSYVDDVLVYPNWSAFPVVGETGKIYVTEDTNKTYRWSGSGYVVIADGVALGETATTAYRGDRGKAAYDHSLSQGNPHNATTSDIPEGNKYYFTESRARASILTGVIFTNKNKVTSADSIETAIGKVQGQLDDLSVPIWVNGSAIGIYGSMVKSGELQFIKRNGNIYMRGAVELQVPWNAQQSFFKFNDGTWGIKRYSNIDRIGRYTNLFRGGLQVTYDYYYEIVGAYYEFRMQTAVNSSSTTYNGFWIIPETCIGEAL